MSVVLCARVSIVQHCSIINSFFFFSSRRRHTRSLCDWSSDVCSSDLFSALATEADLVLIDYPAEGGPLLTNALVATRKIIIPLVPETPALEGVEGMLRLMARGRASGHKIDRKSTRLNSSHTVISYAVF